MLSFLTIIKTDSNSIRVGEGSAMWLAPNFIQEAAKEALSYRLEDDRTDRQQDAKPTTYFQADNYLLDKYATDDSIVKAETKVSNVK